MSEAMEKAYDPQAVESSLYQYWLDRSVFHAEVNPARPPFCIVIPPPNVTGVLHMGHALDETVQDLLIRRKRMQGYEALWVPGTDHAGIATQNVMEARLLAQGLSRDDLGREEFVRRVWQLKEQHHSHIVEQLKRFGCSLDWARERFTLDEGLSRAVREAFVTLYEQGLIYRGARMINWCPRCHTGLSDLEVVHEPTSGKLWYLRYPAPDGGPGVVVATTRPETMLGDTAVAVNPDDPRYRDLVGRTVLLPLQEREIPVLADEHVDPEFGTGAVKVTPAHDPNDALIGERHHLPAPVVIGLDGKMTAEAGAAYAGLDRYDCRRQVLSDLEERGLVERIEPHEHAVGQCQRCATVVEPLVSTQWFVKMAPLAQEGLRAVEEGRVRFVPSRWEKVYRDWLEHVSDWCISRQLWWGHAIPVWYCRDCARELCTREDPTECPDCGGPLERDPDVLDTWFSSSLWPFSTLGWPDTTPELAYFYPTSVLVTAYDIIYFWVARMIMMGMHLCGREPFREVLIHGLVRDEHGRKMSKSLGNAVDPLGLIDEYGADALRFALVQLITHGQDLSYTPDRLVGARNFCNKLWNASRLVITNLQDQPVGELDPTALTLADRWILSRHQRMLRTVNQELDRYNLAQAADALYDYLWGEFCDWYLEIAKLALYGEDPARRVNVQHLLRKLLGETLAALHPIMPFITEAIWQRLEPRGGPLAVRAYPVADESLLDESAEREMEALQGVVVAVRRLRADLGLPPQQKVELTLLADDAPARERLVSQETTIRLLAGVELLHLPEVGSSAPAGAIAAVTGGTRVYLHLGDVDLAGELARLDKKLAEVGESLARGERKLANQDFLSKAPEHVVAAERERLAAQHAEQEKLESVRQALQAAAGS